MGPRGPPSPILTAPPRNYFTVTGTADCAHFLRSHALPAAPSWTCATSTSHHARGHSSWRAAEAPPAVPRLVSLVPAEFEGEVNRLGRARAVAAREAMTRRAGAAKFVGPVLSLGRESTRADDSFWIGSEGMLTAGAVQQTTWTPPLRTSVERPSGANGRGYQVLATTVERRTGDLAPAAIPPPTTRSPLEFIVHREPTADWALSWIATRGFVAHAAAEMGPARKGPGSQRVLAPRQLKTIKCTSSTATLATMQPPPWGTRRKRRAPLAWRTLRRAAGAVPTLRRCTRPRRGLGTLLLGKAQMAVRAI